MYVYVYIHIDISNSDWSGINLQRGFHYSSALAEQLILSLPEKELRNIFMQSLSR